LNVQPGLTWQGLKWAFGHLHGERTYWHPITWISHMADCQVFGLDPGWHHMMNVLLHAVNAVLLFIFFLSTTGNALRSWFVAAVFAFHPLQVDSVAWIAERKNVLSTLFWMLTLLAYAAYATKRPSIQYSQSR